MAHIQSERKPKLRGVIHQYSFFISLITGGWMISQAHEHSVIPAIIYCISLSLLLGTSALYHRVHWNPTQRAWMRRLDHTMIFVLIAGTYTPLVMLGVEGEMRGIVLSVVWIAVVLGALFNLVWLTAPKWLITVLYIALGWFSVVPMPQILEAGGWSCVGAILIGGLLYTFGAVIYVLKRPNPIPNVFGYHEIFHTCVVLAAGCHYVGVAELILS